MPDRIQKILAAAGIASRRKAEEIIAAGRVTLNGAIVTEQGTKADPDRDIICVDGQALKRAQPLVYYLLYKPKGYVTTVRDPEGRPTVMDLLPKQGERVYPVGRLDYASEGLLLMTNDGALAQKLTKAGSHIPKTYLVKISGKPSEQSSSACARASPFLSRTAAVSKLLPGKFASSKTLPIPGMKSFSSKAAIARSAACFSKSASS